MKDQVHPTKATSIIGSQWRSLLGTVASRSTIRPWRMSGPLPSIRTRTIVPSNCSARSRVGTFSTVIRSPGVLPEIWTARLDGWSRGPFAGASEAPSEIRGSAAEGAASAEVLRADVDVSRGRTLQTPRNHADGVLGGVETLLLKAVIQGVNSNSSTN